MNTLNSKVTRGFHPRVRGFKVSVDIDKPNQKKLLQSILHSRIEATKTQVGKCI